MTDPQQQKALFQKLPKSSGSSFLVERYVSPKFETPWHFHEEFELVLCEKGYGKKFIGDRFNDYYEGELYLIGRNLPHWFKADDSFYESKSTVKPSSLVIQFLENFMGDFFFESQELAATQKALRKSQSGLKIIGLTRHRVSQLMYQIHEASPYMRLSKLIELFGYLGESSELIPVANHEIKGIERIDSEKMHLVLEYALSNYKSDIKLEDVASLVKMPVSAFCRYFKSRTQKTYIDFVLDMRIEEAKRQLKNGNKSILNICYDSGFKNLSNFNRQFRKRTQKSPRAFRKTKELIIHKS